MAEPATKEFPITVTEQDEPMPAIRQVTSVANPRRIRLTRLTQDHPQSH